MAQSVVLKGAEIKIYISGKLYAESQNISYTIDYGEEDIYGIDSPFPQEIATTRVNVQGTINGLRVKLTGGLQGYQIRSRINEILYAPYTSLRIKDRRSDIDILWIPQMKVTNETVQIPSKGIVSLNFSFKGIVPYNAIDIGSNGQKA